MKLAHIVPISLLTVQPRGGAYMALSDLAYTNAHYCNYYKERSWSGERVILDNPVHENKPFEFKAWMAAIRSIQPQVIVLPDVIDSPSMTFRFAMSYSAAALDEAPAAELMAVGHGDTHDQFMHNVKQLSVIRGVKVIGISLERKLNNDKLALERRRIRVEMMRNDPLFDNHKIHLLGVSETAEELGDPLFKEACDSADTSQFAVFALADHQTVKPPAPLDVPYPGRAWFGGSDAYFQYDPGNDFDLRWLRANLREWTEYAK